MNATGTINGAFVTDQATGNTGLLWCAKSFGTPLPVVDTDVVRIYYTVQLASA